MTTVRLVKSELALMYGLGKTPQEIYTKYGITVSEVRDALATFSIGRYKGTKTYQLELVDDLREEVSEVVSENKVEGVTIEA